MASPHTTGMTAPSTAATGATSAGLADREALVEAAERGDVEDAGERAEREVARRCGSPPATTATTTAPASAHSCAVTSTASVRGARGREAAEEVATPERRGDDQPDNERHGVPGDGGGTVPPVRAS